MTAHSIQTPTTPFKIGRGILLIMTLGNALAFTAMLIILPERELLMLVWATFNLLGGLILLIPYRHGEKWAWYAIWVVVAPYALVFTFNAERGPTYLGLTFILMIGQLLTARTFFGTGTAK